MPLKVMTIVGTRPEIIKLSRVIAELDRHTRHVLVHTGQNYDYALNQIFFDELEIRKPDHFLDAAGKTAAETIGAVIAKSDAVMRKEKPDALLLLGDTNSCLSVIAAKRRKIPVFHMEAGNRSFDERVPEEINRRIVDHTSDINLPYTEHARRYLLQEGFRPETVIKTGSPMREVLGYYAPKIAQSDVLRRLALEARGYFLVSAHREENVDDERNFDALLASLAAVAKRYRKRVIVSTHPRTRKRLARAETLVAAGEGRVHAGDGLHRLRRAPAQRLLRALRQRDAHRGIGHPGVPCRHDPAGSRTARRHGRGDAHHGRTRDEPPAGGDRNERGTLRGEPAPARAAARLPREECLDESAADHHELCRLREPDGVASLNTDDPLVLVTGASGFVGTALCAALPRHGFRVRRALRGAAHSGDAIGVGSIDALTDWTAALAGVDVVVHLAARTHDVLDPTPQRLDDYRRVNVAGTRRLAEQAAAAEYGGSCS